MKLHKNIVQAVIDGVEAVFAQGELADRVVKKQIKLDRRWGARDRRFIAESIYDMVRWWRWILAIGELTDTEPDLYQKAVAVYLFDKGYELPDWLSDKVWSKEKLDENKKNLENNSALKASIPDWLNKLGTEELGEHWEKEIEALNQTAVVALRVNTLKINRDKLQERLQKEGVEVEPLPNFTDALVLKKRRDLSRLKSYTEGLFEIQDASSQMVAPFSKVSPGMTVIDACAGAGGKTLHLAAQMNNTGRLFSLDVEPGKLAELVKRTQRASCSISEANLIDEQAINRLKEQADVLLIDAPCSGLGVLRRKPDSKWKLSIERLNELKALQKKLLTEYPLMLKKGGALVYVTCSILPSENELQVKDFLAKNKNNYLLEEEQIIRPSQGFDGFYMARLRKL